MLVGEVRARRRRALVLPGKYLAAASSPPAVTKVSKKMPGLARDAVEQRSKLLDAKFRTRLLDRQADPPRDQGATSQRTKEREGERHRVPACMRPK